MAQAAGMALVMVAGGLLGQPSQPAQPAAPGQARPDEQPAAAAAGGDVVLVFWFVRMDPVRTFRYQAYDLRRGQYTPQVRAWLRMMADRYPSYEAYARTITLEHTSEKEASEAEQVKQAARRELMYVASYVGVPVDGVVPPAGSVQPLGRPFVTYFRSYYPSPRYRPAPQSEGLRPLSPMLPSPGSGGLGGLGGPSMPSSPFPYPYARPHP